MNIIKSAFKKKSVDNLMSGIVEVDQKPDGNVNSNGEKNNSQKTKKIDPYNEDTIYFLSEWMKQMRAHIYRMKLYRFMNKKRFAKGKKRLMQIEEVISTEKTYLDLLTFYVTKIVKPSSENKQKLLKPEDAKQIYSNIASIMSISNMLYTDIMKNMQNFPNFKISQSFLSISHFFKMYKVYINNYDTAVEVLKKTEKKNVKFHKFIQKALDDPENNLKYLMKDFAILPVQRIPRYKMLIEGIIKLTHPENTELNELNESLKTIVDCANFVNNSILEKLHNEVFLKLSRILKDKDIFDAPFRKFHAQETCRLFCTGKNIEEFKPFELYLFSDIIVFVEPDDGFFKKKNLMNFFVNFSFATVKKMKIQETEIVNLRNIAGGKVYEYMLLFEREELMEKFFGKIDKNIKMCRSSMLKRTHNLSFAGKIK